MALLSAFDEYPIHQTPEPIAYPASSDRNVYDRNWFGGFAVDRSYFFGFTMGLYPNRGVIDCGFSVLDPDGVQHCLLVSGKLPDERSPLTIGPVTLEVVQPMRRVRVVIDDNHSGISAQLTFSARTAALREPRQIMWTGSRRTTDTTRYNQYGRWDGEIRVGAQNVEVRADLCHGIRDRSWGVRRIGEREPSGPVPPTRPLFVWSQLFWSDHVSHALIFDDADGHPLVRDAADIPLFESEAKIVGIEEVQPLRFSAVRHRIEYQPGTRWPRHAEIDLVDDSGTARALYLRPSLRFHQRGVGYGHPTWPHGVWRGPLSIEHESFRPAELDPFAVENFHVQQLVEASDGNTTGMGVLEHFIVGPYAPAGFGEPEAGTRAGSRQ